MKKQFHLILLGTMFLFATVHAANEKGFTNQSNVKIFLEEVCCSVGFTHCGEPICVESMCASSWSQLSNDILWHQHVLDMIECDGDGW